MELINKDLILKEIPLFADLSKIELDLINARSQIVEYKKGQIIYKEGSAADAFYCIILGRVVVYTTDVAGNETVLEYLHRGKYFGIISLLTNEPHSVTAKAINDCFLLVIKKEDFDFILKRIPQLAIDLSRTLSRRLKNKDIHQKTIFESTVISIFSSYSSAGKTVYALNLALSLKKETHKSIIVLDILPEDKIYSIPTRLEVGNGWHIFDLGHNFLDVTKIVKDFVIKTKFGIDLICLAYRLQDESCIKKFVGVLSFLVNDYHYIILDLPSIMDDFVFGILNQSQIIHLLTSPTPIDLRKTRHLIERLKAEFKFPEEKIKVIINEYRFSKLTHQQQRDLLNYPIYATLPKIEFGAPDRLVLDKPTCEYAMAIRRISRQVGDCLVGLALGVGVAYGFCHIGVLKVIEEEKIPIDVICGSSIGALIASLWATGISSRAILEMAIDEFKGQKNIWGFMDFTFPSLGFIKGKKFRNLLNKYLQDKTFYDVRLPLKIIASDIRRKEPIVLDKGSLAEAVMASCTMPGIFKPFSFKEGILFDGGVASPLPTEILFKMGVKKIIAVNVTPSREDAFRQYEKIKEQLTTYEEVKKRGWFSLRRYFQERFRTNILDIIFSSIELMQSELVEQEAKFADVLLHPDTQGIHWIELHRVREFAKRGEEEARRKLDKIWQLINE